MLKYAPISVYEIIAEIFNLMAATGDYPIEIVQGVFCQLLKPGKKMGPPTNLRPIILLSVLSTILAICLMKRTNSRIEYKIPISQAGYRKGRSIIEHVFAKKLVIERISKIGALVLILAQRAR